MAKKTTGSAKAKPAKKEEKPTKSSASKSSAKKETVKAKPAVKTASKAPVKKSAAKPEKAKASKPAAAKAVGKAKSSAKAKTTTAKPAAKKAAAKPAAKATAKPAAKKVAPKASAKKTSNKPAAKSSAKPAAKKSASKPAAKTSAKPAAKKSASKPAAKSSAKPSAKKSVSKPAAKKSASKPAAKSSAKPAAKKAAPKASAQAKKVAEIFKKPVVVKGKSQTISKAKEISKGAVGRVGKEVVTTESIGKKMNREQSSDKPFKKPEATTLAKGKEAKNIKPVKAKAKAETNMSVPPESTTGAVSKKATIPKTVAKPESVRKEPGNLVKPGKDKKNVKKEIEEQYPEVKKAVRAPLLTRPAGRRTLETKPTPAKTTEDNRTRFSDEELQEFRDLIMKKLKEAKRDFELLKDSLSNKDNGTDDTSPTFKLLEDGSDVLTKEETAQLAVRQQKFIQNLEMALVRIENKTYGICRVTGKLISKDRLRVVPHATLSIEAKTQQ
jgi:RNA polymerase-binding transcription factor DksA